MIKELIRFKKGPAPKREDYKDETTYLQHLILWAQKY